MKIIILLALLTSCANIPHGCGAHDITSQYYCFPERYPRGGQ